jgi:UDP-glucose-4-epimerase GalE
MVRVLVSGGAGYVGSHAARALAALGHDVVTLDNLSTGHGWAVKWGPLVVGDVGNTDLVRRVLDDYQPDAVLHFAGSAYVGESMVAPERYFRNNVTAGLAFIETIVADGVRPFVFSSTCATYGVPERLPIIESEPQTPVNPYGESKLMVEKALRWFGEVYGLPWVAVRYFNAAGADPDGELGEVHRPEPHLIPRALAAARGSEPLGIFGTDYDTRDGTAVRDYVHVSDLATAHVLALDRLGRGMESGGVNLGAGVGSTVREVIDAVEEVTGRSVPVSEQPRRAGDPAELVADSSLAARELGWSPRLSALETIVGSAWAWSPADGDAPIHASMTG